VALQKNLQRVEAALACLGRITNSPKADAQRCERADVLAIPTVGQRVLHHVVESGPARISEIARATRTGDAAVRRQVTQLEAWGLLHRTSDARDRRAAIVSVSDDGRRISQRLQEAADEIFQERLAAWTSNELETLAELMERLAHDLSGPAAQARQSKKEG
jgi:DNA-binding MarR family transcriptional regulator